MVEIIPEIGLCSICKFARAIRHPRGGASYWQCSLAEQDSNFPRYPGLPVIQCMGFIKSENKSQNNANSSGEFK